MAENDMSQMGGINRPVENAFAGSIEETQKAGSDLDIMLNANQLDASEDRLQAETEDNSAMGISIRTKKLVRKEEVKSEKAKHAQGSVLVRKEDADSLADQFSQRQGNREYHIDPPLLSQLVAEELGNGITENTPPDEVIVLIRKRMTVEGEAPDVSIIDKAFEFLMEATRFQISKSVGIDKTRLANIYNKIELAKNKHYEAHAIDIDVARKIIGAVDAVVEKTGDSVKVTLDRYRDIVHNPPDLQVLRKFYEVKGYKPMILELKGLSVYLGGNLKRNNLENPELAQLAQAARKMQGLLGVYRQADSQLPTMKVFFKMNGVLTP